MSQSVADLFSQIEGRLSLGVTILAIEGGSASGKTTLANMLKAKYNGEVIHTDDFFLRPCQRTPLRERETGGNIDYERLYAQVILPLGEGREFSYRPYSCKESALLDPVTVKKSPLYIVEGAYSTHPFFGEYYHLGVFISIDEKLQRERILKRNPTNARDFFLKWIPLEQQYFTETKTAEKCGIRLNSLNDFLYEKETKQ